MAFKITRFIPASPLTMTDPKDPKDPKDLKEPKDLKDPKKPTAPADKEKETLTFDRFAKYRNFPGAKPVSFRPDGSVTMMDEKGHTFGLKR